MSFVINIDIGCVVRVVGTAPRVRENFVKFKFSEYFYDSPSRLHLAGIEKMRYKYDVK